MNEFCERAIKGLSHLNEPWEVYFGLFNCSAFAILHQLPSKIQESIFHFDEVSETLMVKGESKIRKTEKPI